MSGDLIFLDFKRAEKEEESVVTPSRLPLPKKENKESREEKIKRLAAQIESGDYRLDSEKIADAVLEDLLEESDFDKNL